MTVINNSIKEEHILKKRSFVVLALLLVAAIMATLGTGAINVFNARRTSAMKVVTDENALVSLKGDGNYAIAKSNGELKLDFTDGNFTGDGFNPQAKSSFYDVFTITNQSPKTIFVWLEAEGWSSQHNSGLNYKVNQTNGNVIKGIDTYKTETLLTTTGWNFVNGKGSLAYVELDPGEYFTVNINVSTVMANGYGDAGTHYSDWSHVVTVKANTTAPSRP